MCIIDIKIELVVIMELLVVTLFFNLVFFYSWIIITMYFRLFSITKL